VGEEYITEYSTDRIEIHTGAVKPGQRVVLVSGQWASSAAAPRGGAGGGGRRWKRARGCGALGGVCAPLIADAAFQMPRQVDDLVATGGTLLAGANLVREPPPRSPAASGACFVCVLIQRSRPDLRASYPPSPDPAQNSALPTPPAGKVGGVVVEAACVIELPALHGRQKLGDLPLYTLIDIDVDE
jgi:hypothetical protein